MPVRSLGSTGHASPSPPSSFRPTTPPVSGGGLVDVYLTVAIRTSGGNGPGVLRVPPGEAARIVGDRHGVHGDRPPRGFTDGGTTHRLPRSHRGSRYRLA